MKQEYLQLKHFLALPVALVLGLGIVAGIRHFRHPVKHTQNVVLIRREGSCDWFVRPNNEFFEACWDNPPGIFYPGIALKDISYKDDNADVRHFIKAQLEGRK